MDSHFIYSLTQRGIARSICSRVLEHDLKLAIVDKRKFTL